MKRAPSLVADRSLATVVLEQERDVLRWQSEAKRSLRTFDRLSRGRLVERHLRCQPPKLLHRSSVVDAAERAPSEPFISYSPAGVLTVR